MQKMQLTRQQIIALAKNQDNPDLRYEKAFLMHLLGSASNIIIFENLIGWLPYSKRADGSIYKSDAELAKETGLSTKTVERARKILKEAVFEVYLKKANGAPTNHYRLDLEKFIQFVARKLNAEIEKVREWLQDIIPSKAAKAAENRQANTGESDKLTKSSPPVEHFDTHSEKKSETISTVSQNAIGQKSEIVADIETKSSTTSTTAVITGIEKTSDDSEAPWVYDRKAMLYGRISDPALRDEAKAEVHRLHLMLGVPETQIEDWINNYGFYWVNNLSHYAMESYKVKHPQSWLPRALKNKFRPDYKWQDLSSDLDDYTGSCAGVVRS